MNCKHVESNLQEYLNGTLDPVLTEMIDAHISDCETCQKKLDREKNLTDFLKQVDDSLKIPSISKDLFDKMKDIDHSNAEVDQPPETDKSIPWKVRWMMLCMVLIGVTVIGLLIIPFESHSTQQHIGNVGGPGYTWFGSFPDVDVDPYELSGLMISDDDTETIMLQPDDDRVEHTLDFSTVPDEDNPADTLTEGENNE